MKSLASNAIYNILYKSLNVLFPLITIAYVSRVLTPIGVGKVASAQNIVSYFVIVASLGLPTYGVKKIAECYDNKVICSKIFSELAIINAVSSIICIMAYISMVYSLPYFEDKTTISLIVGIQLFANIFNIDWFYQGREEYKYIMLRSFFVKLLALIAVFAFVHKTGDYIVYALIITLSTVSNFAFNIAKLPQFVKLQWKGLEIEHHLKPVLILLATTISIEIYTLADTTMLTLLKGDEIVAYYTNSSKTIGITRVMIASACAVFLPRLNYYLSHGQKEDFNILSSKGIYMLLTFSLPAALGLMLLADDFTFILFGKDFEPSILSMRILALSVITVAISNFTGYQILVSLGKEKIVLYSTILGAIVNVLLNVSLIIPFAHYGAATASVITELIVALYQLYYVKKLIPLTLSKSVLVQIVGPLVAMAIIIVAVKCVNLSIIVETLLSCILGSFIYLCFGLYTGNETIMQIKRKIINK